jgi:hypothetical protein
MTAPRRRIDFNARWLLARRQHAAVQRERDAFARELRDAKAVLHELRAVLDEYKRLRSTRDDFRESTLVKFLHRELTIERARASERQLSQWMN